MRILLSGSASMSTYGGDGSYTEEHFSFGDAGNISSDTEATNLLHRSRKWGVAVEDVRETYIAHYFNKHQPDRTALVSVDEFIEFLQRFKKSVEEDYCGRGEPCVLVICEKA